MKLRDVIGDVEFTTFWNNQAGCYITRTAILYPPAYRQIRNEKRTYSEADARKAHLKACLALSNMMLNLAEV